MKEQLITIETAKLAKEKGFDIPLRSQYYEKGKITQDITDGQKLRGGNFYAVNTQSLLQKWLREKYSFEINIHSFETCGWWYYIGYIGNNASEIDSSEHEWWFADYEEALEEGLQEALKLISNE